MSGPGDLDGLTQDWQGAPVRCAERFGGGEGQLDQ